MYFEDREDFVGAAEGRKVGLAVGEVGETVVGAAEGRLEDGEGVVGIAEG